MTTGAPTFSDPPEAGEAPSPAQVVFVTGVMRSGTTVLQRVISRSCDAPYIRKESQLRVIVQSFDTLQKFAAFAPLDRADYVAEYQALFQGLFRRIARDLGVDRLVLKDPLALDVLEVFQELMPTVRFVSSVRHPLATAASILRVRNRQREEGKSSFITPMGFGDIVLHVARLGERIAAMRERPGAYVVRYEDLISRDPATAARLGAFISAEVRFDLDDHKQTFDPAAQAFWTPEWGGPLVDTALDKYSLELDADELALARRHLEPLCDAFGYRL